MIFPCSTQCPPALTPIAKVTVTCLVVSLRSGLTIHRIRAVVFTRESDLRPGCQTVTRICPNPPGVAPSKVSNISSTDFSAGVEAKGQVPNSGRVAFLNICATASTCLVGSGRAPSLVISNNSDRHRAKGLVFTVPGLRKPGIR